MTRVAVMGKLLGSELRVVTKAGVADTADETDTASKVSLSGETISEVNLSFHFQDGHTKERIVSVLS